MGFLRQEYGSGLPFPSPGDLPDPGIEPASPAGDPALAGRFFTAEPLGKPRIREWVISFSSGPRFARTLRDHPSVLGGSAWPGHIFSELHKPLRHNKAVIRAVVSDA